MELFKQIQNPWLAEIQDSMQWQIEKLGIDAINAQRQNTAWHRNNINGLKSFWQSIGIDEIYSIAVLPMAPFTTVSAHVDSFRLKDPRAAFFNNRINRRIGLNIPIANTANTRMIWFNRAKFSGMIYHVYFGESPMFTGINQVGSLELDQTYLVRTDCPHAVDNSCPTIRIIMTIYMNQTAALKLWPEFKPVRDIDFLSLSLDDICEF